MKYTLLNETGARENGRVTLLGDVLSGKAVVRIETDAGEIFETAQADIDTLLSAPRRAVVRRLLDECASPAHRARLEAEIRKLRGE